MTTTRPSTALVPVRLVFTDAERIALAGFLAGYRGMTREAYALDLRQFTTWCRDRSLPLFAVRQADIEGFAWDLEDPRKHAEGSGRRSLLSLDPKRESAHRARPSLAETDTGRFSMRHDHTADQSDVPPRPHRGRRRGG
jgi:hypothetical protein